MKKAVIKSALKAPMLRRGLSAGEVIRSEQSRRDGNEKTMLVVPFALALLFFWASFAASTVNADSQWEVKGREEFSEGQLEGISVTSDGEVVLAPEIETLPGFDSNFVWDIKSIAGRSYIAAGDPGAAYVYEDGELELLYGTSEDHALSILPLSDGAVLLGTAPRGIIYKIRDDGEVSVFANLNAKYVWDMMEGADGRVYCATGPEGRIFMLEEKGADEVLIDTPQKNIMCLAGEEGADFFYAGTQPGGLLLRVEKEGGYTVAFDAEEGEVRDMTLTDGGKLYLSTAESRPSNQERGRRQEPEQADGASRIEREGGGVLPGRPVASNSIYRFEPETGAYKLASFDEALVLSVLPWKGEILAGTGGDGRLIGIEKDGRTRVIACMAAVHISALSEIDDENVLLGASNPGTVKKVLSRLEAQGTYTSEVYDAGYLSRWGRLEWMADVPEQAGVEARVRTGNSREPDQTWSDWKEAGGGGALDVPMGRFAQVRLIFSSEDGFDTPVLSRFTASYRQSNRPPVIERFELEEPRDGGGNYRTQGAKKRITWEASDPNQDDIETGLFYKGVDERDWKELETGIRDEFSYQWDTTRVPQGYYRLKLRVTDRPSRGAAGALQTEKVIGPFLIDNVPPRVKELSAEERETGSKYIISGVAIDEVSEITAIRVSHNSGEWEAVRPDEDIFDSREEAFTYLTSELDQGEHVFVFIAEDKAGNTGSGKVVIDVGEK